MAHRLFVQEAAKLAPKTADGTYRVVLITEGEGSSGRYSAELIERSAHVFEGRGSYLNHPLDPAKPHLRPVESITGRISNVQVGEDGGKTALVADYTPDQWHADWVAEYQDLLNLSIYCGADGTPLPDGRLDVTELDATDPYRSVDLVQAGGRGGRFKSAEESLRAIESSLGLPEGAQPGSTSAPVQEGENMEKVLEALAALDAKFETFIAESKAAEAARAAEAEAAETAGTKSEGDREAALEAAKAISDAKLLPSQEADILEAFKAGKEVAPLIENAKKVIAEAAQITPEVIDGFVINESASAGAKHDWSV